ncbi:MerR family DNA-binding protein [Acidiphilium sp.]|uniref:MerR family DNA-binding protein n=1 Tax=Acidiphilium sp. TaxID=527 RepID=UPI002B51F964|nr:MerR family DNA-binding protein [Acidiphilium sp.]HQT61921.1 MerR family transcriptional regulator [Acidiphilium sp.]
MRILTIAAAARAAKVNVETIRFYERRGLIAQPARPQQGARHYSEETIARLRFIREAQALGFTLSEITELLDLRADPAADCADVRSHAVTRREDVRSKIAQLERIGAALDALIAACPSRGALRTCTILDAIEHAGAREAAPLPAGPIRQCHPKGIFPMKTKTFSIEGMRCEGCAETVRGLLEREAGVKAVQVAHAPGRARVLFDPAIIDEGRLTATIERPGYRVTAAK